METLFIAKDADLSREDRTLLVRRPGLPKKRVPVEGLRHIVVAGEAGLTTSLLGLLGRAGVRVTVLDWYGNVTGSFDPVGQPRAARVRGAQAIAAHDPARRLDFAKAFVHGAAVNMRANLRYRAYRGLEGVKPAIDAIEHWMDRARNAEDIPALMGCEGQMKAAYYESWAAIDARLDFLPRRRRPPNNPVNCLLSWFNGLVYALVRNEIAKTHLDECMSFLHAPTEARASLSLDLAEVFKPALADTTIIELAVRDRIDDRWFHRHDGVCRLSEAGREATLEEWIRRTENASSSAPSLRETIRLEALGVERDLLGIGAYKPWKRKI